MAYNFLSPNTDAISIARIYLNLKHGQLLTSQWNPHMGLTAVYWILQSDDIFQATNAQLWKRQVGRNMSKLKQLKHFVKVTVRVVAVVCGCSS